tara:strand:- start:67 stop:342 length:276 start_codon:yes stop_codon:yes gene_type:complete
MSITIDIMMGLNGGLFIDSTVTGTVDTNYRTVYVNEDCVFTVLTDVNDVDLIAAWGISGKTIGKGAMLGSLNKVALKTITVSSGSVLALKG